MEYPIYKRLLHCYGKQNWWPGDSQFEIAISAILTQNTTWKNVEIVLNRFKAEKITTPQQFLQFPESTLQSIIRPVGFYQLKVRTLIEFSRWFIQYNQSVKRKHFSTTDLRHQLLNIRGIGNETADAILLYALNRYTSVSDKYTQRLAYRLGVFDKMETYQKLAIWLQTLTPPTVQDQNEIHALIVVHSKTTCTKKNPKCQPCPLFDLCKRQGL
ncbi:MAG: endonuclease [bacterium]|nr:endonuclease [bacterium]